MLIPVYVQRSDQPQTERYIGQASDSLTAEQVADRVGIPLDRVIEGRITRSKGKFRWKFVVHAARLAHSFRTPGRP
jgi:hypothetical protein